MTFRELEPGERIVFRTRYSGRVVLVSDPKSKAAYRADCETCGEESQRTGLGLVRDWATEHAAACAALPKDYVDCHAAAINSAEQASALLNELSDAPAEQRQDRLAQAELRARLAATYAELAGHQNTQP